MTDSSIIQQARDVLAKWRKESTAGPWRVSTYGHGGQFIDVVQPVENQPDFDPDRFDNMDTDIASIKESAGDARLIVGTAGNPDLLDALDGLLITAERYDTGNGLRIWSDRIAAAIIAANERMTS